MSVLSTVMDVGSSLLTGGGLGLLGSAVSLVADHFKAKREAADRAQAHAERIELIKVQHQQTMDETAAQIKLAEVDAQVRREESADDLQAQSYKFATDDLTKGKPAPKGKFGGVLYSIGWFLMALSDVIKSWIRPFGTLAMMYFVWKLYVDLADKMAIFNTMTPDQQFALYMQVVQTVLTMASTSFFWWFGVRYGSQVAGGKK